jgi:hypothetical protein
MGAIITDEGLHQIEVEVVSKECVWDTGGPDVLLGDVVLAPT